MKDLALDLGGSLIVATYGFIKHDEILEKKREINYLSMIFELEILNDF